MKAKRIVIGVGMIVLTAVIVNAVDKKFGLSDRIRAMLG